MHSAASGQLTTASTQRPHDCWLRLHCALSTFGRTTAVISVTLLAACDANTIASNVTAPTHLPWLHAYPNDSTANTSSRLDREFEGTMTQSRLLIGQLGLTTKVQYDQAKPTTTTSSPKRMTVTIHSATESSPRLIIRDLGIDTNIESVGITTDGYMDTPSQSNTVAWYKHGARWGENGNTTITGHYNDSAGNPAVFAKLHTLNIGATIEIKTDQSSYIFEVSRSNSEEFDSISLLDLFGERMESRLNLITCHGERKQSPERYSHRWIIRADLRNTALKPTATRRLNSEDAASRP